MEKSDDKSSVKVVGYWVSFYVHRVRWALKLKGVDYEYIEEDLFNKTPLLSQLNPIYAKVPVIVHHGNPLPESAIILEYIDQVWSQHPLLPQDPFQRAQARFWATFIDQKVFTAVFLALYSEGEDQERAVKIGIECFEKIEEQLKVKGSEGKWFLGGEELGYVDLVMGFVAYIVPVWEEVASVVIVDPLRFPAIAEWMGNFVEQVVNKSEFLGPKGELITFYEERRRELVPLFGSDTDLGKKVWSNLLR